MTTKTYRIPKAFARDHWDRECGLTDVIVKETSDHFYVQMDEDGYGDMISDADYYVALAPEMGPEYFGLTRSAAATLKALRAQGPVTA